MSANASTRRATQNTKSDEEMHEARNSKSETNSNLKHALMARSL
jgi:hypothetical protein